MVNELTGVKVSYGYDEFSNLVWSNQGGQFDFLHRSVDDVGNLYETKEKTDRVYGAGSRLLETKEATFSYDEEGNLVQKVEKNGDTWKYEYFGNGMMAKVVKPDMTEVTFKYDSQGRRIEKCSNEKTMRFVWDGNTILHEYFSQNDSDKFENLEEYSSQSKSEIPDNIVTWVFNNGFVPTAKITSEGNYSIISDYLGTPVEAYDEEGNKIWSAELDIYGRVKEFTGEKDFIPFRYQGQYEDEEICLYYNRFRYYSPSEGMYTQQDPIGLSGGFVLYNYVIDTNNLTDILGLKSNSALLGSRLGDAPGPNHAAHHIVMTGTKDPNMNSLVAQMEAHGINPDGRKNGIWLPVRDSDKVVDGANTSHQQDGLHGKDYKNELFNRLDGKDKEAFDNELEKIKEELNKGRTWETGTTKKLGKCTR